MLSAWWRLDLLSVHLSIKHSLSVYLLFIYLLSFCLSILQPVSFFLSGCHSVCKSIWLSVCLSFCISIFYVCLSFSLSFYLLFLYGCLFVCLFICPSIHLSVCVSFCLSVSLPIRLYICPCIWLIVYFKYITDGQGYKRMAIKSGLFGMSGPNPHILAPMCGSKVHIFGPSVRILSKYPTQGKISKFWALRIFT